MIAHTFVSSLICSGSFTGQTSIGRVGINVFYDADLVVLQRPLFTH